jgi:6-pyruvoyltetrahydropterin/6-carboxytetrahydropterin synthase
MQITRKIVFHSGHMLKDDTSKCFHPHGHEYVLEATIEGPIQELGAENGMVINFGSLKDILMKVHDVFDHKFIVEDKDPRRNDFIKAVGLEGVVTLQCPPTAENLLQWIYGYLLVEIPGGTKITKLKLQETHQCWAELCL